ncbi:MAG: hypothetical protein HZA61_02525 [Candidatus Eisenbacteria bacterium]|uniref:Uncharacterized protein n=1 Tax=Eiseniibacteriota bacterium TaxID=2212470 RepID=A0A933W203_UNCEI|nr:hypothetical protein [Candidatus Eisenbacteria bacterium]
MRLSNRYRLLVRAGTAVVAVVAAKLAMHALGWETLSLNPLFSGIVAANVFLMGFLLNGVLSDFKESERLPGELAAGLENLAQDVRGIGLARADADVRPCLGALAALAADVRGWFHKQVRSRALTERLDALTPEFAKLEQWTQATLVSRLKQEQGALRRLLTRAHTIRETSFIASGYLLADLVTVLLCVGLVLVRIEPFHESLFFVTVIAYFMIYLLMLIRDLDNPFGYYDGASGEDVSLKPLEDAIERLHRLAAEGR